MESEPAWEGLEAFVRQGVQDLLQRMLEEQVAVMLGRRRYARREGVDPAAARAVQAGGKCAGGHLEDAADRGTDVPTARRA